MVWHNRKSNKKLLFTENVRLGHERTAREAQGTVTMEELYKSTAQVVVDVTTISQALQKFSICEIVVRRKVTIKERK